MNIKKRKRFFWVLENKYFVLKNINKNKNKNLGSKKINRIVLVPVPHINVTKDPFLG